MEESVTAPSEPSAPKPAMPRRLRFAASVAGSPDPFPRIQTSNATPCPVPASTTTLSGSKSAPALVGGRSKIDPTIGGYTPPRSSPSLASPARTMTSVSSSRSVTPAPSEDTHQGVGHLMPSSILSSPAVMPAATPLAAAIATRPLTAQAFETALKDNATKGIRGNSRPSREQRRLPGLALTPVPPVTPVCCTASPPGADPRAPVASPGSDRIFAASNSLPRARGTSRGRVAPPLPRSADSTGSRVGSFGQVNIATTSNPSRTSPGRDCSPAFRASWQHHESQLHRNRSPPRNQIDRAFDSLDTDPTIQFPGLRLVELSSAVSTQIEM